MSYNLLILAEMAPIRSKIVMIIIISLLIEAARANIQWKDKSSIRFKVSRIAISVIEG